MKCIRDRTDDRNIVRVPDRRARDNVATGYWAYTSKGAWKAAGRLRAKETYHKVALRTLDGWT
jgi:hypothetical protein